MRKRKRKELIPLAESRRVIYMERRGRKSKLMPVLSVLMAVFGVLFLLYCVSILLFVGYGTRFFLVWGGMGLVCLALAWLFRQDGLIDMLPSWLKIGFWAVAGVMLLLFLTVEGMIMSRFFDKAPAGADYCIVLGAQMKENGPSDVLRRRLDAAIAYLDENPDTQVIVSGSQGANEPVSEAYGMYEYLKWSGIDEERILIEDASDNTFENLQNSSAFLDKAENTVVIVTNNFHMFRAEQIAKKAGYEKVYCQAADSYAFMLPNNMLREFFGVVKDFLAGNL